MKRNKWISLLLSGSICLSFSGCIGNLYENVGTVDGREISSGLYLNLQYDAYNYGSSLLQNAEQDLLVANTDQDLDPLDQELEGMPFADWLSQETEKNLREYVAIERLSAENEVVLGEENAGYLEQLASYWEFSAETYAENGISYNTMMRTTTNGLLRNELFSFYYGPEGELAKSDEEIREEYNELYGKIEYISLPYSTATDPVEDKEVEIMALAEELQDRLEAGESMELVAEEGVAEAYEITSRELGEDSAASSVSTNYLAFTGDEDDEFYPPEFRSELQQMEDGDVGIHVMDSVIMVYRRAPNFENDEMFAEERDNVVGSLYQEEFDAFLADIYEAYPVEYDFGARSYFSPSKIV